MRLLINIVLILISLALAYTLYFSIEKPIGFKDAYDSRKNAVTDRLKQVGYAQEFHRDITGRFAKSFDALESVLKNDSFRVVKIIGDPDDPSGASFSRDTVYRSAFDSIQFLKTVEGAKIRINIDSLRYVPYSGKKQFFINADTTEYQKTMVNVTEVGTTYKVFMGEKYDISYQKYNKDYDPDEIIKIGDMTVPNLNGNWN